MYLGVDGGGTKTALVLVDSDGRIRATHLAPASYYLTVGIDALGGLLADAVGTVLDQARATASDVEFAFFGLPAFGEDSSLVDTLGRLPARCLPAGSYLCGNDMICGWAGALVCRDGITVVAGTGSICYGERGGATARNGGWGELFSDEGSAYWIACRGLNMFSRMSDRRTEAGPLLEIMRSCLQITCDLDVCAHVYSTLGGDRARIAQLSRLVIDAARAGDAAAVSIVVQAADELAQMVDATRKVLGFDEREPVAVSYSGGVFAQAGSLLLDHLSTSLKRYIRNFQLCKPAFPPEIGAALYAAKCNGHAWSGSALDYLRAQSAAVQRSLDP